MSVRDALLSAAVIVAAFVVVTVVVTELASATIEFSLFVGLPAGVVAGLLVGAFTYRWLGADEPGRRRRGAAFAAFGVVFLAVLISLVVVGGMRNSRALPIAAATGVVGAGVVVLRYRRSGAAVAPSGSTRRE